jgi:hypothetical protein
MRSRAQLGPEAAPPGSRAARRPLRPRGSGAGSGRGRMLRSPFSSQPGPCQHRPRPDDDHLAIEQRKVVATRRTGPPARPGGVPPGRKATTAGPSPPRRPPPAPRQALPVAATTGGTAAQDRAREMVAAAPCSDPNLPPRKNKAESRGPDRQGVGRESLNSKCIGTGGFHTVSAAPAAMMGRDG